MKSYSYTPSESELYCLHVGHDWYETGRHRIPSYDCISSRMLSEPPNGTREYIDYKCRHCGREQSDERPYSWQPNRESA